MEAYELLHCYENNGCVNWKDPFIKITLQIQNHNYETKIHYDVNWICEQTSRMWTLINNFISNSSHIAIFIIFKYLIL